MNSELEGCCRMIQEISSHLCCPATTVWIFFKIYSKLMLASKRSVMSGNYSLDIFQNLFKANASFKEVSQFVMFLMSSNYSLDIFQDLFQGNANFDEVSCFFKSNFINIFTCSQNLKVLFYFVNFT